ALGATLMNLGQLYIQERRWDEAEATLKRSIDIARANASTSADLLPSALTRLGSLYGLMDDPERGRPPLNEAIAVFRTAKPVDSAELAYALGALGMIDVSQGFYAQAEAKLREAEALAESSLGEEHPQVAGYQTNL